MTKSAFFVSLRGHEVAAAISIVPGRSFSETSIQNSQVSGRLHVRFCYRTKIPQVPAAGEVTILLAGPIKIFLQKIQKSVVLVVDIVAISGKLWQRMTS